MAPILGRHILFFNPATQEKIAQVPLGDKSDVEKAVAAARKALPIWSKKSQTERSEIGVKIAALLRESFEQFAEIDTLEHGTPAKMAQFLAADIPGWFDWAAYNARSMMGHTIPVSSETVVYLQREPVGVVAIITPWNLPVLMILQKLAPAVMLGNTCVIKPPSINSLMGLKLGEILEKVNLPPGNC